MTAIKHEIEQLVKMASKFDDQDRLEESASLMALASQLVAKAAKEEEEEEAEEKEAGKLSGKQLASLRALKNSCERVARVLGNRIPRSCRKVDHMVEDLLAELKNCDLGE